MHIAKATYLDRCQECGVEFIYQDERYEEGFVKSLCYLCEKVTPMYRHEKGVYTVPA